MIRLLAVLLAGLVALAGAAAAAPAAREAAEVTADLSGGFARLVFVFPRPIAGTAQIRNGVLVVRFARPFSFDAAALGEALREMAPQVRRDSDGRGLRIPLATRDMRLHTIAEERRFVVDLLPRSYAGTPPGLPPLDPPPEPEIDVSDPATLPVLAVRAWPHADFSRLVFDFPSYVDYSFLVTEDVLSIRFAKPMRPDFRKVEAIDLPWIGTPQWRIAAGALVVDVPIDHGAGLHHFRDGTKIAFDVKPPASDGVVTRTPSPAGPPPPAAAAAVPPAAPDAPDTPAAVPPPPEPPVTALEMPGAMPRPKPPTAGPQPPQTPPQTPPAPQLSAAADALPEEAARPRAPDAAPPAAPDGRLVVGVEQRRDGLRLSFPFGEPTPAAIFRRGMALWLVFDRPIDFDLSAFDRRTFEAIERVEPVALAEAGALRLTLAQPLLAAVTEDGALWRLTLGERLETPGAAIVLAREARAVGRSSVTAELGVPSRVIAFTDPEAGDQIIAVTAAGPPRGLVAPRQFIEFSALASAHGLALLPKSDDLEVALTPTGARIGAPRGLSLSSGDIAEGEGFGRLTPASLEPPGFIDFARWRAATGRQFLSRRQELLRAVGAPGASIARARMDIALFYLGNGLAPEALGELGLIARDDPTAALDPAFFAARGLAALLMGRLAEAAPDLHHGSLADDPHAALWRLLLEAGRENWAAARRELAAGEAQIGRYPPDLQARFRIAAAKAALGVNDIAGADAQLSRLPQEAVPAPLALEARLVTGQMLERLGRNGEALAAYQAVQDAGHRPLAVAAAFAEADLRHRTGSRTTQETIETLDRLRFQWRGDGVEFAVLRRLAELQIAEGDFRNGLGMMRAAVAGFGDTDAARALQAQMTEVFEALFIGGKADALPPVQALGLYYDFRELTPIGRLGDDMIRKLADRLIAVDLLAQAAELLRYQVENRLEGVARAQVATRLAIVYLLDRKPEEALNIIRATRQTQLPEDLARERRLLEARALGDLKLHEAALDVIDSLEDAEALRLRADIYWAARQWAAAAGKLEALAGASWQGPAPLSEVQRFDVLRAAVAYSLAEDNAGLQRLRGTFGAKMSQSPDARAFEVVTATIETQGVSFRELAKTIAGTDTLEAFMAGFRDRFDLPAGDAPTN